VEIDFGFAKGVITDCSDGDCKNKEGIVFANQIHSNIVKRVENKHCFDGDGMITSSPNLKIGVYVADCMPILIADHIQRTIAILHSGRAGSLDDIFTQAMQKMQSDPKDLKIHLGPCIKKCCYEIGDEVALKVKEKGYAFALHSQNQKSFLDIPSIVHHQIKKYGIQTRQVSSQQSCTCCDSDYFSYRRDGTSKRFIAYLWIQ
jgi:YfiH family protein